MKIAIVGSGISGLITAYTLQKKHQVTLFEANNYLGGHTHTHDVESNGKKYSVDTGFIVFNDKTYPNFKKFLKKIDVKWQDTEMSFSAFDVAKKFEYNGNNLNTLFSQRKNLFSRNFYRFVREILRFNKLCKELHQTDQIPPYATLGSFLQQHKFDKFFQDYYLLPMASAIWSSSYKEASSFSLDFFIRFFSNHGLLNINDRPQWHVIKGGSREYVRVLQNYLNIDVRLNAPVKGIFREGESVDVFTSEKETFDHVILACHSDQALKLLKDANDCEKEVLEQLKYQENEVTLHTDINLLPKNRRTWASWNYRIHNGENPENRLASVSYNMNILQGIKSPDTYVVSLNQNNDINEKLIIKSQVYSHPVFGQSAEKAKGRRSEICGKNRTHFCGAYWYNGFHEDGVNSALDVAARFGGSL